MYVIVSYGIDSDGPPQTVVQKLLSYSLLVINFICLCRNIPPGVSSFHWGSAFFHTYFFKRNIIFYKT